MDLPKVSLPSLGKAVAAVIGRRQESALKLPIQLPPIRVDVAKINAAAAHKVAIAPVEMEKSIQQEVKPMSIKECSEKTQLRASCVQMSGTEIVSAPAAKVSDWSDHSATTQTKDALLTSVGDDYQQNGRIGQLDRGYLYHPNKDTYLVWLSRVLKSYPNFAVALVAYHRIVLSPRAAAQLRLLGYPAGCLVDAGTGQEGAKNAALWSEVVGEPHKRFEELS